MTIIPGFDRFSVNNHLACMYDPYVTEDYTLTEDVLSPYARWMIIESDYTKTPNEVLTLQFAKKYQYEVNLSFGAAALVRTGHFEEASLYDTLNDLPNLPRVFFDEEETVGNDTIRCIIELGTFQAEWERTDAKWTLPVYVRVEATNNEGAEDDPPQPVTFGRYLLGMSSFEFGPEEYVDIEVRFGDQIGYLWPVPIPDQEGPVAYPTGTIEIIPKEWTDWAP